VPAGPLGPGEPDLVWETGEGVDEMRTSARSRRIHRGLRLAAATMAGVLGGMWAILALDTARSQALDPPDPPTTAVIDHAVTWSTYPERAAMTNPVDPGLVERCRTSDFVVITFSGTGMADSQYQANMIQSHVEDLGGCVMYHWYGHTYDEVASARSVERAVEDVTAPGERKPVVLLGASFGGIAAEDIAAQPAVADSPVIDLRKIIMVATPVDMNDVIQDVFGVPVPLIKDIPLGIPRFGGLVVLGNAVNGQGQRGELLDPVEWRETFTNAAKTRPLLMWSQLERIRKGMLTVRSDIPVDYLGSPDSDMTVDTDHAYARLDNLVMAPTRYFTVPGGGHDEGWLLSMADRYNEKLVPILAELFGQAA